MDNRELVDEIGTALQKKDTEVEEVKQFFKFLVFRVGDKSYALYADEVREIVIDTPIFYIPFVPAYISGLINRHGEPYTVVDISMLFEQKKLDANTFLILKKENDQITFQISDVDEIIKVREDHVNLLSSKEEEEGFFLGSITVKERDIFILNTQSVYQRVESDLDSE